MSNKSAKKKLLGIIYPLVILIYASFIYYAIAFNLYWIQESNTPNLSFLTSLEKWWSYVFLVLYHILILFILWAYLSTMYVDPGRAPNFWVRFREMKLKSKINLENRVSIWIIQTIKKEGTV